MVIEEPIVVNEPKELEVPEFNKKDIKEIAVESVNEGIAKGQVAVGTKLYLHQIKGQDGEGTKRTVRILATKGDAVTTIAEVENLYSNYSVMPYINVTLGCFDFGLFQFSSKFTAIRVFFNGDEPYITECTSLISDTVTEL